MRTLTKNVVAIVAALLVVTLCLAFVLDQVPQSDTVMNLIHVDPEEHSSEDLMASVKAVRGNFQDRREILDSHDGVADHGRLDRAEKNEASLVEDSGEPPGAGDSEIIASTDGELGAPSLGDEEITLEVFTEEGCDGESQTYKHEDDDNLTRVNFCEEKLSGRSMEAGKTVKSYRITGPGEVDLYSSCDDKKYWSTAMPTDGCTNLYTWPPTKSMTIKPGLSLQAPPQLPDMKSIEKPAKYRVVFSCESSEYFGYQVQSNYYGFLNSDQKDASWSRLLTAGDRDDLAETFPTFQAKRHPYSRRYGPLNKADVMAKWVASSDAPREDVIVVIDPDNWLLKDVSHIVAEVKPGNAVAQRAWFAGNRRIQELWEAFCRSNCDWKLDHAAVPYFVHRDDLTKIAPLFREYILLMKRRFEHDKDFEKRFTGIQITWGAEMFGWIFATAELGIRVTIKNDLQVRDIGGRPAWESPVPMIHMGRAWFPKGSKEAKPWIHEDQGGFQHFGDQVWCKCNKTASDEIPWPLPPNTDFQSKHTLTILHNAREMFGPIAKGTPWRTPGDGYHQPYP